MNAKELERFLAARGANASAVDVVIRSLRKVSRVSTGGRGLHAAKLTPVEIGLVVMCYAGSDVASRADETAFRLMSLNGPNFCRLSSYFPMAFQQLISEHLEEASEVRICRDHPYAVIQYADGGLEEFGRGPISVPPPANSFRSEGVIPDALIKDLREALS